MHGVVLPLSSRGEEKESESQSTRDRIWMAWQTHRSRGGGIEEEAEKKRRERKVGTVEKELVCVWLWGSGTVARKERGKKMSLTPPVVHKTRGRILGTTPSARGEVVLQDRNQERSSRRLSCPHPPNLNERKERVRVRVLITGREEGFDH